MWTLRQAVKWYIGSWLSQLVCYTFHLRVTSVILMTACTVCDTWLYMHILADALCHSWPPLCPSSSPCLVESMCMYEEHGWPRMQQCWSTGNMRMGLTQSKVHWTGVYMYMYVCVVCSNYNNAGLWIIQQCPSAESVCGYRIMTVRWSCSHTPPLTRSVLHMSLCTIHACAVLHIMQDGFEFELTYFDNPQTNLPSSCVNWVATAGINTCIYITVCIL